MKYRLGDTVRIVREVKLTPMTEERFCADLLYALYGELLKDGPTPSCFEEYDDIVLTTQEMVDEFNATGKLLQSPTNPL